MDEFMTFLVGPTKPGISQYLEATIIVLYLVGLFFGCHLVGKFWVSVWDERDREWEEYRAALGTQEKNNE